MKGDREELERLMQASTAPAGLAQRARIVLAAAAGISNTTIAAQVGVSRPAVIGWRARYEAEGLDGLQGGRGTIAGTILAVVLLGVLDNAIILFGANPFWQNVARGALLVVAVVMQLRSGERRVGMPT